MAQVIVQSRSGEQSSVFAMQVRIGSVIGHGERPQLIQSQSLRPEEVVFSPDAQFFLVLAVKQGCRRGVDTWWSHQSLTPSMFLPSLVHFPAGMGERQLNWGLWSAQHDRGDLGLPRFLIFVPHGS